MYDVVCLLRNGQRGEFIVGDEVGKKILAEAKSLYGSSCFVGDAEAFIMDLGRDSEIAVAQVRPHKTPRERLA